MTTAVLRPLAAFLLMVASASFASALCGDVNGDARITSSDALGVLRRSVGLDVPLTCDLEPVEPINIFGMANTLTCDGRNMTAQMTWSKRPTLTWSDYTQQSFPIDVTNYQRVDAAEISGTIAIRFGNCGTIAWDIDSWDAVYPMPVAGGAWVLPYYDEVEQLVYLLLELTPFQAAGLSIGDQSPAAVAIASAPALPGLANAAER